MPMYDLRRLAVAASLMALCLAPATYAQAPAPGQQPPPFMSAAPSRPAQQTALKVHLDGVTAVQLAWWFQHMADENGKFWKPLAPAANTSISWAVNPREDAHQLIGAMFLSDQKTPTGLFPGDTVHMQAQFQDYNTRRGGADQSDVAALNPTVAVPKDYVVPFPTPVNVGFGAPLPPGQVNGFNQQLLLNDGTGFNPGRILISWRNAGNDDTPATAGKLDSVDLTLTVYLNWMEGDNRPAIMAGDGYYYSPAQVAAIGTLWTNLFNAMPAQLPKWFNTDTQDDIARTKGWTVSGEIDTGLVAGVDSKMMVWWWNHAMGDAPGISYSFWCPPAHYAIRWLPGFSPADVLGSKDVPTDHVVPGAIYPDLQGDHFAQTGGGMMSYPPAMSPITGRYKTIDPMFVLSKAQVQNFDKERFPATMGWLLHQWEDTPEGLVHRSTTLAHLPLHSPVTQQGFYSEHQLMEGQFWGSPGMKKAYATWLKAQANDQ